VLSLQKLERIKAAVKDGRVKGVSQKRLQNAVNVILELQNSDGGFATYENNRGFGWFEMLNPSEVFGDIMIDYSYVECSMASLTALRDFHDEYPGHRRSEILGSLKRGCKFLKSIQRDDGSWYGSWACCFCYGIWFGIEGLVACGEGTECREIRKVRRREERSDSKRPPANLINATSSTLRFAYRRLASSYLGNSAKTGDGGRTSGAATTRATRRPTWSFTGMKRGLASSTLAGLSWRSSRGEWEGRRKSGGGSSTS